MGGAEEGRRLTSSSLSEKSVVVVYQRYKSGLLAINEAAGGYTGAAMGKCSSFFLT